MVVIMNYLYKSIKDYNDNHYDSLMNKLPIIDQQKINLLTKTSDKHERILGRILLSQLLKNKYCLDYNKLNIKYNQYGKPYLDEISFNISHSHDYVIVAAADNNIGVDIEKIRKVNLSIMKVFCTDSEIKYIDNSNNKYLAFWTIYTLKEAYFKMLGKDLSNMKEVEFRNIDDNIICINNNNLKILLSTEINDYVFAIIYV